jgi:hypothetical protein
MVSINYRNLIKIVSRFREIAIFLGSIWRSAISISRMFVLTGPRPMMYSYKLSDTEYKQSLPKHPGANEAHIQPIVRVRTYSHTQTDFQKPFSLFKGAQNLYTRQKLEIDSFWSHDNIFLRRIWESKNKFSLTSHVVSSFQILRSNFYGVYMLLSSPMCAAWFVSTISIKWTSTIYFLSCVYCLRFLWQYESFSLSLK